MSFILPACFLAVVAIPDNAQANHNENHKPGGGGGEVGQVIRVCIELLEETSSGMPTAILGDWIDSAGYVPYCDGDANKKVSAEVGRNFSIVLNGNNSNKKTAGRTFLLDLSQSLTCAFSVKVDNNRPSPSGPVGDGICDACTDSVPELPTVRFGNIYSSIGYPDNVRLEIFGRDLDDLTEIDSPFKTNARLSFSIGKESYGLHWGPYKNPGGATYAPESDPIEVKRMTTDPMVPNDTWMFESTGEHKACLYRSGGNSGPEYLGQYIVPFSAVAFAMSGEFVGIPDGSTRLMEGADQDPECQ